MLIHGPPRTINKITEGVFNFFKHLTHEFSTNDALIKQLQPISNGFPFVSDQSSARTRAERNRENEDGRMEEDDDLTEDEPEGGEDVIETPPRRRQTGSGRQSK
jgi:hypothetical protein